jgi:hypothetical protein
MKSTLVTFTAFPESDIKEIDKGEIADNIGQFIGYIGKEQGDGNKVSGNKVSVKLEGIKFAWKSDDGEYQRVFKLPPEPIPKLGKCVNCNRTWESERSILHSTSCISQNIRSIYFNNVKENMKYLTSDQHNNLQTIKEHYNTLYGEEGAKLLESQIPLTSIKQITGPEVYSEPKDRQVKVLTLSFRLKVPERVDSDLVHVKFYSDGNWVVQKKPIYLLEPLTRILVPFFVNFVKNHFSYNNGTLRDVGNYRVIVNMIEITKNVGVGTEIDPVFRKNVSSTKWKIFKTDDGSLKQILKTTPTTVSFRTNNNLKAIIQIKRFAVHVTLNRGTIKERKGDVCFDEKCEIQELFLNDIIDKIISKVPVIKMEFELTSRTDRVFNTYTGATWFDTANIKKKPKASHVRGDDRPNPHRFKGKCRQGSSFIFEGEVSKDVNNKKYFPKCKKLSKKQQCHMGIEEITWDEILKSLTDIQKLPQVKSGDVWSDKFLNGYKTEPGNITSGVGPGKTLTTYTTDKDSGIYVPGKQSTYYNGDGTMILDSRNWIGMNNLELPDLKNYVKCMLERTRIIEKAPEKMLTFEMYELYYMDQFTETHIYNIPLDSRFVKLYVDIENTGTILERDGNIIYGNITTRFLLKIDTNPFINLIPVSYYGYLVDKKFIPISIIPSEAKIDGFKIEEISKQKGKKEILMNELTGEFRVSFEDSDEYIQNNLTKEITFDLYYNGSQVSYNDSEIPPSLEDRETVKNYTKTIGGDYSKYYNLIDKINYENKILKQNKWYRFKFSWYISDDHRYSDLLLQYEQCNKGDKLNPTFIFHPIKKIETPRYGYLESWNKLYRVVKTFSEFYSQYKKV